MSRNGNTCLTKLRKEGKLTLVLDLDQTLIDSSSLRDLSPDEQYLLNLLDSEKDEGSLYIVKTPYDKIVVKLRPFVREFLKEASQIFDLYICTLANWAHASQILLFLDPENKYFPSKVITRSDFKEFHTKTLDLVVGSKSAIIILDDNPDVWKRHKENLIEINSYLYFASTCKRFKSECESLAERTEDEDELDGGLASVLSDLKLAHHMYFSNYEQDKIKDKDVRQILKKIRDHHALNLRPQSGNTSIPFKDFSTTESLDDLIHALSLS